MLVLGLAVQVPLVVGLGRAIGLFLPPLLIALAVTGGFLGTVFGNRRSLGSPSWGRLYLVLWPFFVWWTLSLLFTVLSPIGWLFHELAHLPAETVRDATLALAGLGTLAGLSGRARVNHQEIAISGLPAAFDGYRIAQISDLHCGPFASGARVDRWVAKVNDLGADLVAVTGDLIASGPAFVPVVAASLGKLRGRDGVYACMGNHDYFTDGEEMIRALERAGLQVLRNRGVEIRRAEEAMYVAGVDDTWTHRNDVTRALAERPPGTPAVLLAHDPALFPEAAAHRVDLTLSGHTHGGQIGVPFMTKRFNLARLMTPFTTGLYRDGSSILYVNRGLGATGLPVRLAVPPEIAVITLRRAEASASQPVAVGDYRRATASPA
ncbi:MAG TPA: metallophosphoesterase [Polyangia bacterium]|nr:metallophosphoesterase [Polyangia bacterium]